MRPGCSAWPKCRSQSPKDASADASGDDLSSCKTGAGWNGACWGCELIPGRSSEFQDPTKVANRLRCPLLVLDEGEPDVAVPPRPEADSRRCRHLCLGDEKLAELELNPSLDRARLESSPRRTSCLSAWAHPSRRGRARRRGRRGDPGRSRSRTWDSPAPRSWPRWRRSGSAGRCRSRGSS